jgi:hypothetical protein
MTMQFMHTFRLLLISLVACAARLAACGGGGRSSSVPVSAPASPPAAPPPWRYLLASFTDLPITPTATGPVQSIDFFVFHRTAPAGVAGPVSVKTCVVPLR